MGELYVDGVEQQDIFHDSTDSGGAEVWFDPQTNLISVQFSGVLLVELSVDTFGKCHFSSDVTLLDCGQAKDTVIGLLGSPNGDVDDDWMDQEGIPLEMPSDEMGVFFGPAFEHTKLWKIDDETLSLFETHYAPPDEEYDSSYERSVMTVDPEIEEVCGEDVACRVEGRAFGKEAAEEYKSNPASKRSPP